MSDKLCTDKSIVIDEEDYTDIETPKTRGIKKFKFSKNKKIEKNTKYKRNKILRKQISVSVDSDDNICFTQPVVKPKNTDYQGMCNNILENLEKDTDVYTDAVKITNKIKQIKDIGACFRKKNIMSHAFASTVYNVVKIYPCTYGGLDRKMIEATSALETIFDDNVYGNPIGTEVRFGFIDDETNEMIKVMDMLNKTTKRVESDRVVFGTYRLDKVYKEEEIIRSQEREKVIKYVMILTDTESNISIKATVSNMIDNSNLRINNIDMEGSEFFESMTDVMLRKAVISKDFNFIEKIKSLNNTMTRTERVEIWKNILDLMSKEINIINQGYEILDIGENKMIKFSIEKKEPCSVTLIKPPFINIHLECKHNLSIMTIYGIVFSGKSDDSESIVCPLCRANLIPKLVQAIPDNMIDKYNVKIYEKHEIDDEIDNSSFNFEKNNYTNQNASYVLEHEETEKFIDSIFDNIAIDADNNDNSDIAMRLMSFLIS